MMKHFIFISVILTASLPATAQNFFPLGSGFNYPPGTLYADTAANLIYAGGNFSTAGGVYANEIAQWNGTVWDSLGCGMDQLPGGLGSVTSVTKYKGEIYVGGSFKDAGCVYRKGLAKWDGTNWITVADMEAYDNIGNIIPAAVWGLYEYNNELYVMGNFELVNGMPASKIVKYDGASWTAFPPLDTQGGGFSINCAMFYNNELYVGGNFSSLVGDDIARFNGTNWVPVGSGLSGFNTDVGAFAIYNGELYVGGYFETSFGDPGNYLVKWNGSNWVQLPAEPDYGQVDALMVYGGKLYAGGTFLSAGGVPQTAFVAAWDGSDWSGIGGFDNGVGCFTELNGDLYIGGGFWTVNGDTMNRITRYTGANGIDEIGSQNNIAVYPNPSTGKIKVAVGSGRKYSLEVYNVLGEKVLASIFNHQTSTIDLSAQPNGIYLLQLKEQKDIVSRKIVKY